MTPTMKKKAEQGCFEPAYLYEPELLNTFGESGGGAIVAANIHHDYQLLGLIYIGVATPAKAECPHWHPRQEEVFYVVEGEAEMICKFRLLDDDWIDYQMSAGAMMIVPPETCHYLRWKKENGLALVFKAPQEAGAGTTDTGKVLCHGCPHQKHCLSPNGWNEEPSMIKPTVVLVGYGQWGKKYAEYLLPKAQQGRIELFVVDQFDAPDELQGEHVTFINAEKDNDKIPSTADFVFIVCNDESHVEYMRFWRQRCNMLVVEKPFSPSLEEMIEFDKELKV